MAMTWEGNFLFSDLIYCPLDLAMRHKFFRAFLILLNYMSLVRRDGRNYCLCLRIFSSFSRKLHAFLTLTVLWGRQGTTEWIFDLKNFKVKISKMWCNRGVSVQNVMKNLIVKNFDFFYKCKIWEDNLLHFYQLINFLPGCTFKKLNFYICGFFICLKSIFKITWNSQINNFFLMSENVVTDPFRL